MTYRNAKAWRGEPTDAEKAMWRLLRNRALQGAKFRRQHPIGPFVVDFVCLTHRLVVELDGGQHADRAVQDKRRTAVLSARGYRVLRFWHDVLLNPEGALTAIAAAVTSNPSPRGSGEREGPAA